MQVMQQLGQTSSHQNSESDCRREGSDAAVSVGALEVEDEHELREEADKGDVATHHEQLVHTLSVSETGFQRFDHEADFSLNYKISYCLVLIDSTLLLEPFDLGNASLVSDG